MADSGHRYVHPSRGWFGRLLEGLVNGRPLLAMRRAVMSRMPFLKLRSDVLDVVYCTWMVDADRVRALVPAGVELHEWDGKTPFTILTYAHGHFGPELAGPLRTLFASPLQSNWRLYVARVQGVAVREPTVYFVMNMMSQLLYTVGSRLFSDALPSHQPRAFVHRRDNDCYLTRIEAGMGSAVDFACTATPADTRTLPEHFQRSFGTWQAAADFICRQDVAIVENPQTWRLAMARIDLPVAFDALVPLRATEIANPWLELLGATEAPLCFALPRVAFRVLAETLLPAPGRGA